MDRQDQDRVSQAVASAPADQDGVAMVTGHVTVYQYLDPDGEHRWGVLMPYDQGVAASHSLATIGKRITSSWLDEMLFGDD